MKEYQAMFKTCMGLFYASILILFLTAWSGDSSSATSESVSDDEINLIIQNIESSARTDAEKERGELLMGLLEDTGSPMAIDVASAVKYGPAGTGLIEKGLTAAAESAWKKLKRMAYAGDRWVRFFKALVHHRAA